jgi:hypothetical protein
MGRYEELKLEREKFEMRMDENRDRIRDHTAIIIKARDLRTKSIAMCAVELAADQAALRNIDAEMAVIEQELGMRKE